ncbi:MAG: hypothetical protein AUG95_01490 [Nitrospirae bacterium 13_1_20CM_4_62_6]|nr:MAG: hypothetical protein AUG95_01490 [Nitrospirae bacterium 13_1_20CM_4_62_6]
MNSSNLFRAGVCVIILGAGLSVAACGWFKSDVKPDPPRAERPRLAVLPFDMGIEITSLASIQSVSGELKHGEEPQLIEQAVKQVQEDARRLMYERLASKEAFELILPKETDRASDELGITTVEELTPEQLAKLRARLNVDLVVTGIVQDYGKVRWQWMAAGMVGDITWESVVIGLATAWNPAIILGNVGFELLTSTPIWFGGGYLFGVAFRPVRVEAQAVETQKGITVWDGMEVAIYARGRIKELPEEQRSKKEMQLHVNLKKAMETLADSLLDERITKTTLWERRLPRESS